MTDADIEATARFAAYERILEYLLTAHLARRDQGEWDDIKGAITGPGVRVVKGLTSISDLERIEAELGKRIAAIFDRAVEWAGRARD